jgi:hypothetical protein
MNRTEQNADPLLTADVAANDAHLSAVLRRFDGALKRLWGTFEIILLADELECLATSMPTEIHDLVTRLCRLAADLERSLHELEGLHLDLAGQHSLGDGIAEGGVGRWS